MGDESERFYAGRSFESVLGMFADTVLRACLVHCGSDEDAKDCFQNTFIKLYTCETHFNDTEHIKAWLLTVAMHECSQLHRSRWSRCVNLSDDMNSVLLEHEEFMTGASADISDDGSLLEIVLRMAPTYREVIYLYYYEEMDIRHIAQILGISPNTVKTRLRRGKKQLKMDVKEEWGIC